jgi:predicted adenylyl cyclase CyaB
MDPVVTPARNVEIKARVADPAALRARVAPLATAPPLIIGQRDTFFAVARGRLKLRRFDDGSGRLIFYERDDTTGPKTSYYSMSTCPDAREMEAVLARALGVRGVVDKRRELFMIGRTRVHLDEVRDLGHFLELEVVLRDGEPAADGEREARALLAALAISPDALLAPAYIDLLEARTPR